VVECAAVRVHCSGAQPEIRIPEAEAAARLTAHVRASDSPATIRVTVLVVVVTLVVVIIVVVVAAPLWTLSVVEIGGFLTTRTCCFADGAGLSRQ